MRPPRIPPMLSTIIQTGISAVDEVTFTELSACPQCGGSLSGYDTKKKQFAHLLEDNKKRTLYVYVKRFYCRNCKELCYADEPFYPNIRIGSPVVDLCTALCATMPANRVATYLTAMGIPVDRTICRHYIRDNTRTIPTTDLFGMHLPLSVFTLSTLATRTSERGRIEGAEVLAACGFPSAQRAALHQLLPPEKGDERNKQKHKE
jgi:hypothetical protein